MSRIHVGKIIIINLMKEEAVKQGLRKECDVDRQRGSDRHFVCVWELLSLLFRSSNICLPFYSLYLPDKGEGLQTFREP